MKEKRNIINEKLASVDHQLPMKDMWSRLEKELPEPPRKRRYVFWLLLAGLLAGLGSWWTIEQSSAAINQPQSSTVQLQATNTELLAATDPSATATTSTTAILEDNKTVGKAIRNSVIDTGSTVKNVATATASTPAPLSAVKPYADRSATAAATQINNEVSVGQSTVASATTAMVYTAKVISGSTAPVTENPKNIYEIQKEGSVPSEEATDSSQSIRTLITASASSPTTQLTKDWIQKAAAINTVATPPLEYGSDSPLDIATSTIPVHRVRVSTWSLDLHTSYGMNLDNPIPSLPDTSAVYEHLDVWSIGLGISYALGQGYGIRAGVDYTNLTDRYQLDVANGRDYSALDEGGFSATEVINRYTVYDQYVGLGLSLGGYYDQPLSSHVSIRPEIGIRYHKLLTYPSADSSKSQVSQIAYNELDRVETLSNLKTSSLGLQAGLHLYYSLTPAVQLSLGAVYTNHGLLVASETYPRKHEALLGQARLTYRF